jgi:hypothetical protein
MERTCNFKALDVVIWSSLLWPATIAFLYPLQLQQFRGFCGPDERAPGWLPSTCTIILPRRISELPEMFAGGEIQFLFELRLVAAIDSKPASRCLSLSSGGT